MLTETELKVLNYWESGLEMFYRLADKRSMYRDVRLYTTKLGVVGCHYELVSNLTKERYEACESLLAKKYLSTFTGRGGKFYQLTKKGFEFLFINNKVEIDEQKAK